MFRVENFSVVVGFHFGSGRGSILTLSRRKMLKTVDKLKLDKNEVKSKMVFRVCDSQGVDKNGAKDNMEFGRRTTIFRGILKRSDGQYFTCASSSVKESSVGDLILWVHSTVQT